MGAFNGKIDVHACRCYADASVVVGIDCGNRIKRDRDKPRQGVVANTLDFAHRANIDRSYMGGVERGERNLSFKKLCAIATALGRDVGSLTRGLPVRDRD